MPRKLLLFDIDGTLLISDGIGRHLIDGVLRMLCHRTISSEGVSFSGKTDPQILREILLRNHVTEAEIADIIPEALEVYVEQAQGKISPDNITALPGIHHLLHHLSNEDAIQLALLTGNHQTTAYLKLQAACLDHYFPFGAFGSDHANRAHLPAIAVHRALRHNGHTYTGHDIVIIGDSTWDITCGRSVGAFSVAVCTGMTSHSALAEHQPDLLLPDLTDVEHFCRHVLQA